MSEVPLYLYRMAGASSPASSHPNAEAVSHRGFSPDLHGWSVTHLHRGESRFINSQTRPLHASEGDETRRQGSNSP